MAITNFGQSFPTSYSTDSTISASSLSSAATITSSAYVINNSTSGSELLDTEFNLVFTYPNSAPTGVFTVYLLRRTQGGYQATTDPGVYSFTFTPTQNAVNNVVFTVYGCDASAFKVAINNGSGFAITTTTMTLYYVQSVGQFG